MCVYVQKVPYLILRNCQAELNVNIGNLPLKNPVMTASGTFGYGIEYADFMDISRLGGIFVKGTTIQPREGMIIQNGGELLRNVECRGASE